MIRALPKRLQVISMVIFEHAARSTVVEKGATA